MKQERRKAERVETNMKGLLTAGQKVHDATVVNCSEDGACIVTDYCLPCDSKVNLHFSVFRKLVRLSARIVRISRLNEHVLIGLRVSRPPKNYLTLLHKARHDSTRPARGSESGTI